MSAILTPPRTGRKVYGVCGECSHKHPIDMDLPVLPQMTDWYTKHCGHKDVRFVEPTRSMKTAQRVRDVRPMSINELDMYLSNADIKLAYAASAAVTITFASLAASSTWLAGRESTAIDNGASVKYLEYLVAGNFKSAASNNQAGDIYVTAVGARDDTPSWPDVFDGTDSAETVSKSGVFNAICKLVAIIGCDNTASQTWYFGPNSLARCFGGVVPDQFVYFVTHNIQTSTNVWSATEGDHSLKHTPMYATSV